MVPSLRDAASAGDLEGVRAALAAGADVNERGEFGDTALNLAAEHGHAAVVNALVSTDADISNRGGADKTPLMNAAFAGHAAIVRQLLEAGAMIDQALLRGVAAKVRILEENAEDGAVRTDAAQAWRGFLDGLVAEYEKQQQR